MQGTTIVAQVCIQLQVSLIFRACAGSSGEKQQKVDALPGSGTHRAMSANTLADTGHTKAAV
jgi:hypothetical protein